MLILNSNHNGIHIEGACIAEEGESHGGKRRGFRMKMGLRGE